MQLNSMSNIVFGIKLSDDLKETMYKMTHHDIGSEKQFQIGKSFPKGLLTKNSIAQFFSITPEELTKAVLQLRRNALRK